MMRQILAASFLCLLVSWGTGCCQLRSALSSRDCGPCGKLGFAAQQSCGGSCESNCGSNRDGGSCNSCDSAASCDAPCSCRRLPILPFWKTLFGCNGCSSEVYWSEWHNDPPACNDPCDRCGSWGWWCSKRVWWRLCHVQPQWFFRAICCTKCTGPTRPNRCVETAYSYSNQRCQTAASSSAINLRILLRKPALGFTGG